MGLNGLSVDTPSTRPSKLDSSASRMRSVRVLDVLFTAQSAVNLLSRVVASQTGTTCRIEAKAHTYEQSSNIEESNGTASSVNTKPVDDGFDAAPSESQSKQNHGEQIIRSWETRPQENAQHTLGATPAMGEEPLRHVGVRQRYTKRPIESFELGSLPQIPPVSRRRLDPFSVLNLLYYRPPWP